MAAASNIVSSSYPTAMNVVDFFASITTRLNPNETDEDKQRRYNDFFEHYCDELPKQEFPARRVVVRGIPPRCNRECIACEEEGRVKEPSRSELDLDRLEVAFRNSGIETDYKGNKRQKYPKPGTVDKSKATYKQKYPKPGSSHFVVPQEASQTADNWT